MAYYPPTTQPFRTGCSIGCTWRIMMDINAEAKYFIELTRLSDQRVISARRRTYQGALRFMNDKRKEAEHDFLAARV